MSIAPVIVMAGADPLGETMPGADCRPAPTAAQRRTERQRRVFKLGFHPVGNPHGQSLRLHPDAPPVDDRDAPGPRCGSCAFRALPTRQHQTPKCTRAPHAYVVRLGRGRGGNVPEWWPGCVDWEQAPAPVRSDDTEIPTVG